MSKIVVLDGHTLNPGDLSWDVLNEFGTFTVYPRTAPEQLLERAADAQILIVNKQVIDAAAMQALPNLQLIAVSATGYNNVDIAAAHQHGIKVANVAGYSTPAVAQHVFAMLLQLTSRIGDHHRSVQNEQWVASPDFCYTLGPITELTSLRMGIYGLGRIGQAVAQVALAFGMEVYAHHKHPERDAMPGVRFVDLPTLFATCQVVSLHAPLNVENERIVGRNLLARMPQPSYLINTGRGGLINEEELAACLQDGTLTAACLDVLSQEPPPADHPLLGIDNCFITPHIAWATVSARQRLLQEVVLNIEAFLSGEKRNNI